MYLYSGTSGKYQEFNNHSPRRKVLYAPLVGAPTVFVYYYIIIPYYCH